MQQRKNPRLRLGRRAGRLEGQAIGAQLEKEVEDVLLVMKTNGEIIDFIHHPQNSPEDRQGKDFSVQRISNGKVIEQSFGVTRSEQRMINARNRYPTVYQIWIPYCVDSEGIARKMRRFFRIKNSAAC